MAVRGFEFSDYVSDPRDDFREWRQSDRPAYDAVHGVLEIILVVGLGLRFFSHLIGYGIYHESRHDEPPELSDEMFEFNNIVKPLLEPEHWHQEALMRGATFAFGLLFLGAAVSTPAVGPTVESSSISPTLTYWGRLFIATHLLLDPLLGIAWRIATTDLRAWVSSRAGHSI